VIVRRHHPAEPAVPSAVSDEVGRFGNPFNTVRVQSVGVRIGLSRVSWKLSRTVLRGGATGNGGSPLDERSARQPYFFHRRDHGLILMATISRRGLVLKIAASDLPRLLAPPLMIARELRRVPLLVNSVKNDGPELLD
jgi:hypothetical protein